MNSLNESKDENKEENQTKYKPDLHNINSDYFLQKLFNICKKSHSLQIFKYNKKLQKRLNINLNDYKEYSEIFSPIEIEIIPSENKFGIFINSSKKNKSYIHIYLNDSKQEIRRNYLTKKDKVSKIKIIIDYQVKSLKGLFNDCKCIESIYFNF